jgi:hypothetical protein
LKIALKRAAVGAKPRVSREELGRKALSGLQNAGEGRRRGKPVADGGEVARTAAVEAQARERP